MQIGHSPRDSKYALIEIFIGTVFGLIFGFMDGAYIGALFFGLGVLFSLSRTLLFRWFVSEFENISESYKLKEQIKEIEDKEFINEAIMAEKEFIEKLQQLAKGTISYSKVGKYLSAAESQINKTERSMKATALVGPEEWLKGELKEYLDKQIEAIKKNKKLKIKRIFFLTEEEEKDKKIKEALKKHADGGIEVYIADKDSKNIELPPPFVIYDGKVAIVGNLRRDGKISGGIKTIDPVKVNELIDNFDHLLRLSSKKFERSNKESNQN